MSITAEQYQRSIQALRVTAAEVRPQQREVMMSFIVRTGFRLGLSRRARNWHSTYTRINPWGKGGFVDRTLERLAFFE